MQAEYEELENLGYVKINWEEEHKLTAVITDQGREYLASLGY
jgi:DNA-binding PadR family transcriptional regulator